MRQENKIWNFFLKTTFVFLIFTLQANAQSKILNNGVRRVGNGAENSINASGNMQQPFYYNSTLAVWRKLTYSNFPLDIRWGIGGDGTNNWNINGTLVDNPTVTNPVYDYSAYIPTNVTPGDGYGTIKFTGNITINGQLFLVENTYTLGQTTGYFSINVKLTNISGSTATNVRLWLGTRDDWVGDTDQPLKERGNLVNNAFVVSTVAADQAKAIKISTGAEAVMFFSNSPRTQTATSGCCNFSNATNQNPATAPTSITNDGSYAIFVRMNDLANGQSDELDMYYASGTTSEIGGIIEQVGNAAGAINTVTCNSANYTYSASQSGTTSYILVPSTATAPTTAQIEAGVNYPGGTIVSSGNFATTANVNHTFNLTSLTSSTNYTIYAATKYFNGTSNVFTAIQNSAFTTLTPPSAPTATASQSFCNSATVANLVATGTGIKWYDALTNGNLLSSSTALASGTTYYASQTVGVCESARTGVTATINISSAPTANATQVFYNSATVANLVATGTGIQWYDALTGGNLLSSSTALVSGSTYYASQTVGTCESTRTAVLVIVHTSTSVLAQIGNEGDSPNVIPSVVTVAQINTIVPAITGAIIANESAYQAYIDANPSLFSSPATAAEVQAMVDAVNASVISSSVLVQIGNEGDSPNVIPSVVTVAQINTIVPAITGLNASNESAYQAYIDANPSLFSSPATATEVQAMVDAVNASADVLAQIGNEGDEPNTVPSVVTVAQINTIVPAITGALVANESAYQAYIDANPSLFSSPATAAEVQAMIDTVNASLGNNNFDKDKFNVYPNPVTDILNLSYSFTIENVIVYDILGKEIFNIPNNSLSMEINMSGLSSGTYIVRIFTKTASKTYKIIKRD